MSSLGTRRLRIAVAVLVILTTLAAACQPNTPAPGAGKAVTIRMLAMQQAGLTPDEMDEIAVKFSEAHEGVKVDVTYVGYDNLHDKIVTSLSGSTPAYDVFLVDDIWYAKFAKAGWLLDITDRLTSEMKEDVFESHWEASTIGGRVYGMPWLVDVKHFYYNQDILQQAGFDAPPSTWEEMVEMGKAMKEAGLVEYPTIWSWAQAEAAIADFVTLVCGNGGEFFDKDGEPVFNNERGVEVLTWMVNSIADGFSSPASISSVEEDVRNVFSQGKVAFALNWLYMYDLAQNDTSESQVTGKVGMGLMPAFKRGVADGIKSASLAGPMGMGVAAKSPNADLAWEWIKFITSKPIQMEYSAHLMPIWSSAFQPPDVDALLTVNPTNPVTMPIYSDQVQYSVLRPRVPYYTEASVPIQLALQEALTGKKTPQQALDDAAAAVKKIQSEQ